MQNWTVFNSVFTTTDWTVENAVHMKTLGHEIAETYVCEAWSYSLKIESLVDSHKVETVHHSV